MSDNQKLEHLEELAKSLESTTTLLQSLLLDIQKNSSIVGSLAEQIRNLTQDVEMLSKIVRGDGNVEDALVTRIILLEKGFHSIEKAYEKKKRKEEALNDKIINTSIEGKWKLAATILSGLLAILATIIGYELKK